MMALCGVMCTNILIFNHVSSWSKLKYLKYLMGCHEIWYRYSRCSENDTTIWLTFVILGEMPE